MNLMEHLLFFVLSLHKTYGVIYYLNASEYERMPPIYKLDSYSSCLQEPNDVYCTLNFQLVSDEPNELLHMIQEYSEHSKTHFNHTKLRYGICISKNCQNYIQNKTSVSETILEGCLNQSFWENYQLKTRIQDYSCYTLSDNEIKIEAGDVVAGIIVLAIIMLNIVSSLYDVWCTSNKHEGNHTLLLFSIKRNWKKLSSTTRSKDPRLEILKGINGIKCVSTYMAILVHCGFSFFIRCENVHDLELSYHNIILQILLNASIMIQSYFVISAFLMTYKMNLDFEKQMINWRMIPKEIFNRYFRLTPVYALVILLLATWYKFFGPGPLWKITGEGEMLDCKKRWWMNLLYLNNYFYNFRCLIPSWYLAADMQLYCCSLVLYVTLRNSRLKNTILMSLIIVGGIIPAVQTYVRDLDFGLYCTPSAVSELFAEDPAFNETYKTAHGNISSYAIGMYLGYFLYRWQNKKIDERKYWIFKYIYRFVVPLFFAVGLSGVIFYRYGPREPLYIRVLFSAFSKPIVGTLIAIMIAGMAFKWDNIYRNIFERDMWIIPSRLSYCVYLIHFPYIFIHTNMQNSLSQMTAFNVLMLFIFIAIASFVTAIPIFLLVETPFTDLSKYFTKPSKNEAVIENTYNKKNE